MAISWNAVEREEAELERQLADGEISYDQFRREMRYLRDSIEAEAQEAAENAYRDAMGWY